MNPLVYEDLFFTICDHLTLKQIVKYELISKHHLKMIRQHRWDHCLKIETNDLLLILIKRYQLKNLNVIFYLSILDFNVFYRINWFIVGVITKIFEIYIFQTKHLEFNSTFY